jgi:small subunit ribosomal protein S2
MAEKKTKKKETFAEKVEELVENVEDAVVKGVKQVAEKAEELVEEAVESVEEKVKPSKKSTSSESKEDKKAKLAKILEKAKKLESKVEDKRESKASLKSKVTGKEEEKEDKGLVPIEDYLKSSIHLGTKVITPDMRKLVYKRRADGLAVFNTELLDNMIREGADYLAQFSPEEIILVCKREAGWKAVEMFSKITGVRIFTKKYPAGILTNSNLENFMEANLIFICDPWLDKNALADANRIRIPVLSVCDTNNYTQGISKIIPGNNKSAKSLGMVFYLLAKTYSEKRGLNLEVPPISEWIEGWDNLIPPK